MILTFTVICSKKFKNIEFFKTREQMILQWFQQRQRITPWCWRIADWMPSAADALTASTICPVNLFCEIDPLLTHMEVSQGVFSYWDDLPLHFRFPYRRFIDYIDTDIYSNGKAHYVNETSSLMDLAIFISLILKIRFLRVFLCLLSMMIFWFWWLNKFYFSLLKFSDIWQGFHSASLDYQWIDTRW